MVSRSKLETWPMTNSSQSSNIRHAIDLATARPRQPCLLSTISPQSQTSQASRLNLCANPSDPPSRPTKPTSTAAVPLASKIQIIPQGGN